MNMSNICFTSKAVRGTVNIDGQMLTTVACSSYSDIPLYFTHVTLLHYTKALSSASVNRLCRNCPTWYSFSTYESFAIPIS